MATMLHQALRCSIGAAWLALGVGCTFTDLDDLQRASSGTASATGASTSSATGGPAGAWLDPAWRARRVLVVQASRVAGPLSDFVVYVDLSSLLAGTVTPRSDGRDLRFTDVDHVTLLPHELVRSLDGRLGAWVRLPTLSDTENTAFDVYYGNGDAPDPPAGKAVWQDLYLGVWHLDDDIRSGALDATANANDGTALGTTPVAGVIGTGQEFGGAPTLIEIPVTGALTVAGTYTVSAWVNRGTDELIDVLRAEIGATVMIGFRDDFDRFLATTFVACSSEWPAYSVESDAALVPNGEWAHVAVSSSYPEIALLVQGNIATERTVVGARPPLSTPDRLVLGKGCDPEHFLGLLDEVRITDRALSREWLKTEYNNQSQPDTFVELQPEELGPSG
jgi:hypothetical protein